jgi:hypothetical protein
VRAAPTGHPGAAKALDRRLRPDVHLLKAEYDLAIGGSRRPATTGGLLRCDCDEYL